MLHDPICAVTVCIDHGDFLRETAKHNAHLWDKWVVVSTDRDEETRHVCRVHGMTCILTDDATRDGKFGKGRLIERGLQHLHADCRVMHHDADVVFPARTREYLSKAHLESHKIYGFDRFMVRNFADWKRLESSGWVQAPNGGYQQSISVPFGFQLGARWVGQDGWLPIGFAQFWDRKGGTEEWNDHRAKPYPIGHGSACREDVQHALQWDRRRRELIPEVIVAHLESEAVNFGANWNGRTTKRFGPPWGARKDGPVS